MQRKDLVKTRFLDGVHKCRSHLIPQILKIAKIFNPGTNYQKCDRASDFVSFFPPLFIVF
ncbi:hypothetical protein [Tychonema sp. BBK16]|uniref:hypothetical protein n=1 Tax=Tychonema sp. BBK16 TaxID=2699888 RepID=UPI001F224882|nr:hypothetical protein [Tychonema sp. BBK16]MCF6371717.1 hypothetical protein [Tychonema sp. BBK16]